MHSTNPHCADPLTQELTRLEPVLRGFVQTLRKNPHDIDDVVQETLLRALRHDHLVPGSTRLTPWLLLTARNVHIDLLRRSSRQCILFTDAQVSDVHENSTDCEDDSEFRELQNHVRSLVGQLHPVDQEIARLMLADQPPRTIAGIVGLKQGTVRSKICRTRKVLRTELESLGLWDSRMG